MNRQRAPAGLESLWNRPQLPCPDEVLRLLNPNPDFPNVISGQDPRGVVNNLGGTIEGARYALDELTRQGLLLRYEQRLGAPTTNTGRFGVSQKKAGSESSAEHEQVSGVSTGACLEAWSRSRVETLATVG